jgi:hypothetical protein
VLRGAGSVIIDMHKKNDTFGENVAKLLHSANS